MIARGRVRGTSAEAERRYRALFEHMSEGFVICEAIRDARGRLIDYWIRDANPMFIARAPRGDVSIGHRQLEVRPDTDARWFEICDRALHGHPVRFEFLDPLTERWHEAHMVALSDTEFGQFFVDVTDRKRAEARQAQLFDELNHRVKNNLSIVSSMLELQARNAPPRVREELGKAVDRIRSIAEVHAALYRQNSPDRVELCSYIDGLTDRLSHALVEDGRIRLEATCDLTTTSVQEAVSIGLIINELVTNAAKHAFEAEQTGRIRISLATEDGTLWLRVEDDGRGLGALADGKGLGWRMVQSLVEGLGGSVEILEGPGGRVEVRVPRAPPQSEPAASPTWPSVAPGGSFG